MLRNRVPRLAGGAVVGAEGGNLVGAAGGNLALTGAATGSVTVSAMGAGGIPFSGLAAGAVKTAGIATGAVPFTGVATGRVENRGTASGVLAFSGSFSGSASGGANEASGGGAFPLSGAAAAAVRIVAAASGAMVLTGSAAGQAPVVYSGRFAFPAKPAGSGTLALSRRGGRIIQGGFGMNGFTIKRGDTSPAIRYVLEPATVDLTGATVRFQMRVRNGPMVLDAAAAIVTATGTPTVQYVWQALDTAAAGLFEAEFRVLYGNGAVETFPNQSFIVIRISEDVRPA